MFWKTKIGSKSLETHIRCQSFVPNSDPA
ncbi:hypothetical protein L195_g064046, partial [Trifolium pratense]